MMTPTQDQKEYITGLLEQLEAYDNQRPEEHPYPFHDHSYRVADLMKRFAMHLGHDEMIADALYWATLPHDIGKIALPIEIWDLEHKPTDTEKQLRRSHTTKGLEIIKGTFTNSEIANSPFLKTLYDIMENHHETINGTGFLGKAGEELSEFVRMACICDSFDGWSIIRPHFDERRDLTPAGVIRRMETEKTGQFDTALLQSFKEMLLCQ